MMRYRISEEAISDLEKIWLYTFKNWSQKQADRYYKLIIDEIEHVANNYEQTRKVDHIRTGYSMSKVKSHLIFFKKSGNDVVEIIRILH